MDGERTCRSCREMLPAAAFRPGDKECLVCQDPPGTAGMTSAEGDPLPMPHAEAGRYSDRYQRADSLDAWIAAEDARLEELCDSAKRRIDVLDRDVRLAANEALGPNPSPAWATIVGSLVIAAWDTARRLSGLPELCVGDLRKRGGAPFGSMGSALYFALMLDHRLGVGEVSLVVAEDRREDQALRAKLAREGRGTPAGSRRMHGRPRAVLCQDGKPIPGVTVQSYKARGRSSGKRADLRALLLEHPGDVLEDERFVEDQNGQIVDVEDCAMPESAPAPSIEASPAYMVKLPRPIGFPRAPLPGGYLPVEFMPAKQTRSGSTGGTKNLRAVDLRADVLGAIRAAKLGPTDLRLVVLATVGDWQRIRSGPKGGFTVSAAGAFELVRLKTHEILEQMPELATVGAEALGKRIARSRRVLVDELVRRGLVPPPEVRQRESARRSAEVEAPAFSDPSLETL